LQKLPIKEKEKKIIASFCALESWQEKYELIIKEGKNFQVLRDEEKIDAHLVKGCQSKSWLRASLDETKKLVVFEADSEALIVKGLVSLLLKIYSYEKPTDIIGFRPSFFEKIGMEKHLSPNRANGLFSFIKQINLYALALRSLVES